MLCELNCTLFPQSKNGFSKSIIKMSVICKYINNIKTVLPAKKLKTTFY